VAQTLDAGVAASGDDLGERLAAPLSELLEHA
jgi:hypothetical protein